MKYQSIAGYWPEPGSGLPKNPAHELAQVLGYISMPDDLAGFNLEPLTALVCIIADKFAGDMHDIAYNEPDYWGAEFEGSDLHHYAFNRDEFIVYTSDAVRILDELGYLQALRLTIQAQREIMGDDIQAPELLEIIDDPVRLVNLLAYFIADSVLNTAGERAANRYGLHEPLSLAGRYETTNAQVREVLEELSATLTTKRAEVVREEWGL